MSRHRDAVVPAAERLNLVKSVAVEHHDVAGLVLDEITRQVGELVVVHAVLAFVHRIPHGEPSTFVGRLQHQHDGDRGRSGRGVRLGQPLGVEVHHSAFAPDVLVERKHVHARPAPPFSDGRGLARHQRDGVDQLRREPRDDTLDERVRLSCTAEVLAGALFLEVGVPGTSERKLLTAEIGVPVPLGLVDACDRGTGSFLREEAPGTNCAVLLEQRAPRARARRQLDPSRFRDGHLNNGP